MNVLIVTGLSGAGKTRALQILEDMGYYCMDNISPGILLQLVQGVCQEEGFSKRMAVTMDIRSYGVPNGFLQIVKEIKDYGVSVSVLFLDCGEEVLLKRYKESRRLHPLMNGDRGTGLLAAIRREAGQMKLLRARADYVVDTSALSTSKLQKRMESLFEGPDGQGMRIEFVAFGYKYGILAEADLVFDVRCVENPYYVSELREKTGLDPEVCNFIMDRDESKGLLARMMIYLEYAIPLYEKEGKAQLVVGIGCSGGQHRSVAFARMLETHFAESRCNVRLGMRDMDQNQSVIIAESNEEQ